MAEALPEFLTPALVYISSLPFPLNTVLINVLLESHRLFTSILKLLHSLQRTSNWDAQHLLPPLISLLLAYYALWSVYRTTRWTFSVGGWLIKWGVLIGGAITLFGYLTSDRGEVADGSLNAALLGMLSSAAGKWGNQQGNPGARVRPGSARKTPPKPWDSFIRHQEWRGRGDRATVHQGDQLAVRQIVDEISRYFQEGLGKVVDGLSSDAHRPKKKSRVR